MITLAPALRVCRLAVIAMAHPGQPVKRWLTRQAGPVARLLLMRNSVHHAASVGYDRGSGAYGAARPTYPDEAVKWLCTQLELRPGDHVVELGAGTGIFTSSLIGYVLTVTATEPVERMRRKLAEVADEPVLYVRDGSAEETGLADDCADAVFAATAWHWFDPKRAIREVHRLLRNTSRGGLGLIWNSYDRTVPWVAELADIALRRRAADSPSEASGTWQGFFQDLDGWLDLGQAAFPNPWPTTARGIVERISSSSAIASLPAEAQAKALEEAWAIMTDHNLDRRPTLDLPYMTKCYWTKPI